MKRIFAYIPILALLVLLVGCTTLHEAAREGYVYDVERLLDEGADVNARDDFGNTPLLLALDRGKTKVAKLLIDRGADVNVMNKKGWTALMLAAVGGYTDMAKILIEKGADVDKAISGLNQKAANPDLIVRVNRGLKLIASLLYEFGRAYYSKGEYQKALNSFKQAISIDPSESFNFRGLSASYNALKQYDEAITAAKRAIELKPDNAWAYNDLGNAYYYKKQFDEALNAYHKAIEIEPKEATFYTSIGNLFSKQEDYSRAADYYKKAAELTPNITRPLFVLAITYRHMGRYDDAIEAINKAIALCTVTGIGANIAVEDNYPVIKGLYENGPAMRAGIQVGDRIVKIDGQSTKRWNVDKILQKIKGTEGTQVTLTIERKGETFEKDLKRETMISKVAAPFFAFRSLAYREKGDLENAIKDAEQASSLYANDDWAKRAMSITYIDKGKYNDALKILSTIKDSPFARMLEATAYAKLGEIKKAVEIYTSIPDDYLASKSVLRQSYKKALLATLTPYRNAKKDSAKSFEAKGQYREALMEYAEILKISNENDAKDVMQRAALIIKANPRLAELPEEARRHVMRAEVSTKEGKFEDAIGEYKEAAKVAPFFPALYKAIALNYAELKQYRLAINNLKTYLALYPDAPDARTAKDEIYKWEFMLEKGGK